MRTRALSLWMMGSVVSGTLMSCGDPQAPPPPASGDAGTPIDAWAGGTVNLGREVTLRVPASSLPRDTRIAIARLGEVPQGGAGSFQPFGQGYELTPHGTEFALAQPARISVAVDRAALSARGLDARTAQLFHYDEAEERYVAVAGVIEESGALVASIEHFSKYVVMAQAQAVGAPGPAVALQAPVPNQVRAGSPIYLRATVLPAAGTAIAAVRVHYRKLHPVGQLYELGVMTPDRSPATPGPNTYGYLVPAAALGAGDLAAGDDFEWYVEATDSLGVTRTLAATPMTRDVTRSYAAGTLALEPATLEISSGFEKWLPLMAQDDAGDAYQLVPESVAVTSCPGAPGAPPALVGAADDQRASGIHFKAMGACAGVLSAGASGEVATAAVTVRGGQLAAIALYKYERVGGTEVRTRLEGTHEIKEGHTLELDALGSDAYGNTMQVNVSWQADAALGAIDGGGRLSTLDGSGFGKVTASVGGVGGVSAVQWVNVMGRSWQSKGAALNGATGQTWVTTAYPLMGYSMRDHAVRLRDGRVLAVGRGASQLYHPGDGNWTAIPAPWVGRMAFEVGELASGKVLTCGGFYSHHISATEVFDPQTNSWRSVAPLILGRNAHRLIALPDGRMLAIGGVDYFGARRAEVEAYDEVANRWIATPPMRIPRSNFGASLLDGGRVLVTGGYAVAGVESSAELRDPATGEWTATPPMLQGRANHIQVTLLNGKVLVAGGYGAAALSSAELYDPVTNTWTAVASMHRFRSGAAATLLPDGKVFVVGGSDGSAANATADLYDPVANTWTLIPMLYARYVPAATLLASGRVLVTSYAEGVAEIYLPSQPAPAPSLVSHGADVLVAWHEPNALANRVHVQRWTGTAWVPEGSGPVSSLGLEASWPRLAVHPLSGARQLVWQEQGTRASEIQVRRWNGAAWAQDVAGSLNVDPARDAVTPAIGFVGPTPHVTWSERDAAGRFQIYVRRWNGATWTQLGGSLNREPASSATAPSIAAFEGVPYVAWREEIAGVSHLFVSYWDGAAWTPAGNVLNSPGLAQASELSLHSDGETLSAVWRETLGVGRVHLARWDGGGWQEVGSPYIGMSGRTTAAPRLDSLGGIAYVAFREGLGSVAQAVVIHRRAVAGWARNGGSLNIDPARDAFAPALTFSGSTPFAAWAEANGTTHSIYVKALE